ncbi:uncharacterized protein LOC9642037 [Selaginella moellendorffii]|nr:uncharacterized protein LOC9642037 [Selaginella moellendorffii]|eukprot:XP_002986787.2 uncharacterized protein LOC9642037 [Selaginella moellendorffii]
MATGVSLALRPGQRPWPSFQSPLACGDRSRARALPHSLQRQRLPSLSSIFAARAASSSTGSDYQEAQQQGEEYATKAAPKKKQRRLQKTFQHLAHRPVERPRYLLWTSCAVFVFLMRRVIFEELARWPGFFVELWELLKALGMLVAKLLALHAKDTTVWTVTYFGWAGLFLVDLYHFIVDYAPVWGLLTTIALTSAVVSLGEAVRSKAANQPWIVRLATLAGLGAYLHIWDFAVTAIILALLSAASYLRNRDVVTALLPSVATLVAVGRPIVQAPAIATYLLLAIYMNWAAPEKRVDKPEAWTSPPILVAFAIAIGMNVAVNWLRSRHLVWLAT